MRTVVGPLDRLRDLARWARRAGGAAVHDAQGSQAPPPFEARDTVGPGRLRAPVAADRQWRPDVFERPQPGGRLVSPAPGAQLGNDVKVFHDASDPNILLRQTVPRHAPPGIACEISAFDGAFFSLVFDLPRDHHEGLGRHHILSVDLALSLERPLIVHGRLNLRHGPNTERCAAEVTRSGATLRLDFDLGSGDLAASRIDAVWLDLIFERPAMARIELHDMLVFRTNRAEF